MTDKWRRLMRTGRSKHVLQLFYNCLVDFKCVERVWIILYIFCYYALLINPPCKKLTRRFGVIYTHLCMHFSTCMIHNFVLKLSHFIFESPSHQELTKSYWVVQAHSYFGYEKPSTSCLQAQKRSCSVTFCTGHVIK